MEISLHAFSSRNENVYHACSPMVKNKPLRLANQVYVVCTSEPCQPSYYISLSATGHMTIQINTPLCMLGVYWIYIIVLYNIWSVNDGVYWSSMRRTDSMSYSSHIKHRGDVVSIWWGFFIKAPYESLRKRRWCVQAILVHITNSTGIISWCTRIFLWPNTTSGGDLIKRLLGHYHTALSRNIPNPN